MKNSIDKVADSSLSKENARLALAMRYPHLLVSVGHRI